MSETEQILSALQFLSARCDGAHELDGQGFNGMDSDFGKSLALNADLTPRQAAAALKMLRKYRKQLSLGGIDLEGIEIECPSTRTVAVNGTSFLVGITFQDREARDSLKAATRPTWDPTAKTWRVSFSAAEALKAWAEQNNASVSPEAAQRFACDAVSTSEAHSASPAMPNASLSYDEANGVYVIVFAYGCEDFHAMKDAVKACEGSRWNVPNAKAWNVPANAVNAEAINAFIEAHNVEVDASAVSVLATTLATYREEIAPRVEASSALDAEIEISGLGGELMPFQRAGVKAVEMNNGTGMIADEQGLGKTVQALAAIQSLDAFPALVVCESHIKINWQRHVDQWLPGRSCTVLSGTKADPKAIEGFDIVILNYDLLDAWGEVLGA